MTKLSLKAVRSLADKGGIPRIRFDNIGKIEPLFANHPDFAASMFSIVLRPFSFVFGSAGAMSLEREIRALDRFGENAPKNAQKRDSERVGVREIVLRLSTDRYR